MTTLRIKQVRSRVGNRQVHHDTLRTLGLRRIGQTVERPDTPSVRGLIKSVHHLVTFEEVAEPEPEPRAAGRKKDKKAG